MNASLSSSVVAQLSKDCCGRSEPFDGILFGEARSVRALLTHRFHAFEACFSCLSEVTVEFTAGSSQIKKSLALSDDQGADLWTLWPAAAQACQGSWQGSSCSCSTDDFWSAGPLSTDMLVAHISGICSCATSCSWYSPSGDVQGMSQQLCMVK